MDTNWNNTAEAPCRGGMVRALCAALAFFIGMSLMLASVCDAVGRWTQNTDPVQWWKRDWRQTQAFRDVVSEQLQSLLTLGAGGELEWYDAYAELTQDAQTLYGGTMYSYSTETSIDYATPMAESERAEQDAWRKEHPDWQLRAQKNLQYRVFVDGTQQYASEDLADDVLTGLENAPEGFGFVLRFAEGGVTAQLDGQAVDIYGNGVYAEDSLWYVPGYENFRAGSDVDAVEVLLAVRSEPIRFITASYADNAHGSGDSLYWCWRRQQSSQAAWCALAEMFAAGALLMVVYGLLRRARAGAERAIARVTRHICTEVRVLSVGISAMCVMLPVALEVWYTWNYHGFSYFETTRESAAFALSALGAGISNGGAVLWLFWSVWLIRNDHRCNPDGTRWSALGRLSGALRRQELKYPLQKRMNRSALLRLLVRCALLLAAAVGTLVLYSVYYDLTEEYLLFYGVLAALAAVLELFWVRRDRALARDFGRLADQVRAVQAGALDTPLALPEESDLRDVSERLNDLQSGLKKAVDARVRSERMKVELVSNVSHDLKTPLTSILSYSALLLQEELAPVARDYATIIEQKAQRLGSMVQDVFEVSKAASDQLPIEPERLDFGKLLRQTLADLDENISQSGLTLRTQLPEQAVMIVADGRRMYRVFQNLIQNVLRYSLSGSRVYLTLECAAGIAQATLRNTSQTELPDGVDFTARFVRGDDSRTDGGSGLGLSIAKSFTEACGGSFRVETVADLFTVTVSFPLAEAE